MSCAHESLWAGGTKVINKVVLASLFLAVSHAASPGEPQVLMHIVWPFDHGSVDVKMVAEPPLAHPEEFLGAFKYGGRGDAFVHAIRDPQSQRSFGYKLHVKPMSPGLYEAVIGPLTPNGNYVEVFTGDLSNPVLPKYPKPQHVHDGDTIALDLLVNHDTGQRIVDYILISSQHKDSFVQVWQDPQKKPRDFTVDDVALQFSNSSLTINGKPYSGAFCVGGGHVVWFDLPGKGRYVLSIMPRGDYKFQTGVIRDNLVSFTWDNDRYEITTSSSILKNEEPFNVYVLNDPSFPATRGACGGSWTVEGALARPPLQVRTDVSRTPDAAAFAEQAKSLCEEWYPKINTILYGADHPLPFAEVEIIFAPKTQFPKGVPAFTNGNRIYVWSDYIKNLRPDDYRAMMIHELTHVNQHYGAFASSASWVNEGIADYVRHKYFEKDIEPKLRLDGAGYLKGSSAKLDQKGYLLSYTVASAFLFWLEERKDENFIRTLNAALSKGEYSEELFPKHCGASLDALWQEFLAQSRPAVSSGVSDSPFLRLQQQTAENGKVQVTGQNISSGPIVAYVVVFDAVVKGAHQHIVWSKASTGPTIGVGKTVKLGDMPASSDLTQAHVFVDYVRLADGTAWGEAKTDQAKEMAAHSDMWGGPFRSGAGPQAVPVGPPPTPKAPKP